MRCLQVCSYRLLCDVLNMQMLCFQCCVQLGCTLSNSIGSSLQLGPHVLCIAHARLKYTCAMHSTCETENLSWHVLCIAHAEPNSWACAMHRTCPAEFHVACGMHSTCEFRDFTGICYAQRLYREALKPI